MPQIYMVRSPGARDFKGLSHLLEGHVYDNVSKADAEKLVAAGVAEEFDGENELHVRAVEEFHHLDARRGVPVAAKSGAAAKPAPAAADYEGQTVEELHKLAADRNLEGRAGLNKADLIKLIEKDDAGKARGRK